MNNFRKTAEEQEQDAAEAKFSKEPDTAVPVILWLLLKYYKEYKLGLNELTKDAPLNALCQGLSEPEEKA